ncbi:uncharacterized protein LOC131328334 [Rhododendron vialii]|uniref:uncharacterized protein LOC131328334 n=1 Tax=Rhododendron vialii TaxID=182163 RepID=UPI00265F24C3|nr:uncharacterized protein LOC131328334 [Rhododendron vialii]
MSTETENGSGNGTPNGNNGQPPVILAQNPPIPTAMRAVPVNHGEKPEKFTGVDFKRWQQKMLFYLTTLSLARFLSEDAPVVAEDEQDMQVLRDQITWKENNYLCKNYVLNCLHDALYSVYCVKKSARELWESLDRKYKTKDAGSKKFVVGRFLDYKMVDSKTVISQVQELQVILHEIATEGMLLCEPFQVACMIEKLPPGWKDFKLYLKHKRKAMTMEDLIVRLRIEEDNKMAERRVGSTYAAKANVVEQGQSSGMKKHQFGK